MVGYGSEDGMSRFVHPKVSSAIDRGKVPRELKKLVIALRKANRDKAMTRTVVGAATRKLGSLGHAYRSDMFPPLRTRFDTVELQGSPTNLAEALLWKLRKWPAYENFVFHHSTAKSEPGATGVVFYAFAKHLRKKAIPIYDQHVLRALWAIGRLNKKERDLCKKVLMNGNEWEDYGSGSSMTAAYALFLEKMAVLRASGVSNEKLDKLLMPLGQALKKHSSGYANFVALCRLRS
jgi:hypothetical protein